MLKDYEDHILSRPYTDNPDEILGDIKNVSAVLMPSKREGFGLVALEALAVGIPILVSVESGFAHLLYSSDILPVLGKNVVEACIAEVDGVDSEAISADWANKMHHILTNQKEAFARAAFMRTTLQPILRWKAVAKRLSVEFAKLKVD